MKQFKQPLVTILIIFATAYMLSIVGCAPQSSDPLARPTGEVDGTDAVSTADLQPIPLSQLRECTTAEFSNLVSWGKYLKAADAAINAQGDANLWKKNQAVVKISLTAINMCDEAQFYHELKPCKRTIRNIIVPEKPTITGYDAARIQKRCELPNLYLNKFNLRPDPNINIEAVPGPTPINPVDPIEPPAVVAVEPNLPVSGGLRQCSTDEFSKLKLWKSALDQANKNIAKLGSQANWKYESVAVESSASAAKSCESLMAYHQSNACERKIVDEKTKSTQLKIYNRENIRSQCETTRLYTYEYAQRSESLIVPNAKLLFDASSLANQLIAVGSVDVRIGEQCLVSNLTSNDVTYSAGQQVLLAAARVYPPQNSDNGGLQMFVFETEQGIKVECYGVEYPGVKTSKSEVVRLLRAKNTKLSLRYELN